MKRQIGSVLLGMLIVLVCVSTFVIMDQMYDDEDTADLYRAAPVEDMSERLKSE